MYQVCSDMMMIKFELKQHLLDTTSKYESYTEQSLFQLTELQICFLLLDLI